MDGNIIHSAHRIRENLLVIIEATSSHWTWPHCSSSPSWIFGLLYNFISIFYIYFPLNTKMFIFLYHCTEKSKKMIEETLIFFHPDVFLSARVGIKGTNEQFTYCEIYWYYMLISNDERGYCCVIPKLSTKVFIIANPQVHLKSGFQSLKNKMSYTHTL